MRTPSPQITLCLTLLCSLSGCASLTPEQCRTADWRQIGYSDGASGMHASRIEDHAKACADQNIRPDLNQYLDGRRQGLLSYCQPEHGFELGRQGIPHIAGDCVEDLKQGFLEQYSRGSLIHNMEVDIQNRQDQIDHDKWQIRNDEDRIASIRGELQNNNLPNDQRSALMSEFERLVSRKENLHRAVVEQEEAIERLHHRIDSKLREFGH